LGWVSEDLSRVDSGGQEWEEDGGMEEGESMGEDE